PILSAAAIVLHEKNERVLEPVLALEFCNDLSDSTIHAVDHGCIDFHTSQFPFAVLHILPLLRCGCQFPFRVDESQVAKARCPVSTEFVISLVKSPLVFGDIL